MRSRQQLLLDTLPSFRLIAICADLAQITLAHVLPLGFARLVYYHCNLVASFGQPCTYSALSQNNLESTVASFYNSVAKIVSLYFRHVLAKMSQRHITVVCVSLQRHWTEPKTSGDQEIDSLSILGTLYLRYQSKRRSSQRNCAAIATLRRN